ncbi:MAG: PQQ-binding-like beta-propeller repeat protein [Rhodopila sp.]
MPHLRSRLASCLFLLGMASALAGMSPALAENQRALNAANVPQLKLMKALPTQRTGAHTGGAVVVGDTAFLVTPFPQAVYAIALDGAGFPVRWQFAPAVKPEAGALPNAGTATPAVADGRVYFTTSDGQAFAIDAATGRVLWQVTLADPGQGEAFIGTPLIADAQVILGTGIDDFGVRGAIVALDAATGRVAWRHTNVGSDGDVGITAGFRSLYVQPEEPDAGIASWPPDTWQNGGGGLSGGLVYDAGQRLVIHGTGHPAPWQPDARAGDNLWTSGLFARDAATGEARWFDPINPHDLYGLGAGGSLLQADMVWRGERRRLLLHPSANGYVYVLDRTDGRLLDVRGFVHTNATTGVDVSIGALHRDAGKDVGTNSTTRDICPGWPGATGAGAPDTGAAAFLPETGLLYVSANLLCMDLEPRQANFIPGTPFTGANIRMVGDLPRGALIAWDVTAAKLAWRVDETFPVRSGVLATADGVVFYGTLDGDFKAVDGRSGRKLWQFHASSGIVSQPTAFRLPDGRPGVMVLAGAGGAANPDIDVRDATAAHGAGNALRDLKPPRHPDGMLYVFALP